MAMPAVDKEGLGVIGDGAYPQQRGRIRQHVERGLLRMAHDRRPALLAVSIARVSSASEPPRAWAPAGDEPSSRAASAPSRVATPATLGRRPRSRSPDDGRLA